MRQFVRWVLFCLFWISLSFFSLHLVWDLINGISAINIFFVVECSAVILGFILFLLSFNNHLFIASPRLGMKVIHDTGIYWVDLDIEHFNRLDPKTNLFIYQDKILWKKRISHATIGNDYTELELANEINKLLLYRQKEIELTRKIKQTVKNSLNLLSIESKRKNKIKSIF